MYDPVKVHYDALLAKCYSRAMGGFEARAAESAAFFTRHGVTPKGSGRAVDLGAGSGFQSIPLARAGFSVTAVDFSPALVDELAERARGLAVRAVAADFRDASAFSAEPAELAVCMGDTLSHLAGPDQADAFFRDVHAMLEENGLFVLSYRNQEAALTGADGILPVLAEDDFIFTCALTYGEDHIDVADIVWFKDEAGWRLEKSVYRKMRLRRPEVAARLEQAGFALVAEETARGMVFVIARKS